MSAHVLASSSSSFTSSHTSRRNKSMRKGRAASRATAERLEARLFMAFINWFNRGPGPDGDNFDAVYGDRAAAARQLVDVAIADWSFVIQNFNFADPDHPNEFQLRVRAADTTVLLEPIASGITFLTADAEGKPFMAEIVMDNDGGNKLGGWVIPEKWLPPGSFTNPTDFDGKITSSRVPPPVDFYTVILHELGHAMGLTTGSNLRINQFLTQDPGNANLLNFSAGSTSAIFTKDGGGHIQDPAAPTDLMRASIPELTRRLITPLDVGILRDAYGYDVWDPNDLVTLFELPPYWSQFCTYFDLTLEPGFGCTIQALSFAPVLDAIDDVTVDEGGTVSFKAVARDGNPGEVFSFFLGDGAPAGATIHPNTGRFTWTPTDGQASATITVRVGTNGGCGCGGTAVNDDEVLTVTVNNVAPAAGVAGAPVGVRGQPLPFTLTATDAGADDRAAGFTYAVDYGDGSAVQTVAAAANNGAGVLASHPYAANGTYTVRVTATDKDGANSIEATHTVTIAASAVLPDPGNPAASAFFLGGTTAADDVRVTPRGVSVNGVLTVIPPGVGRLVVFGQDGDDAIQVSGSVLTPVILDGGAGNDRLTAARGDDILIGGAGDDELKGLDGRDMLIGGLGDDDLFGQAGEDILVSGATIHDADLTALTALMAEWSRADLGFTDRSTHIRSGGAGALNGSVVLDAVSLIDDGIADSPLIGGPDDNLLL